MWDPKTTMGFNKAWHISLRRTNILPLIKAEKGNPAWEINYKKPAQAPRIGTDPSARNPTNKPSCATVSHMQMARVCPMQAPYLLVHSPWTSMTSRQLALWVPLSWPWILVHKSFLSLLNRFLKVGSSLWLWISTSAPINFWMKGYWW